MAPFSRGFNQDQSLIASQNKELYNKIQTLCGSRKHSLVAPIDANESIFASGGPSTALVQHREARRMRFLSKEALAEMQASLLLGPS